MAVPVFTPAEARTRSAFLALMWALSHPGRVFALDAALEPSAARALDAPLANLIAIGDTLLDLETTFFTPHTKLAAALVRTTARPETADAAAYHFYPRVTPRNLLDIEQASVGDMLYPDRAATLVMGCTLGSGVVLRLRGPGIKDQNNVRIDGIPAHFWELRAGATRYPLGWDLFLVSGVQVVGIPRTTELDIVN